MQTRFDISIFGAGLNEFTPTWINGCAIKAQATVS
jgi:hypothetical protein